MWNSMKSRSPLGRPFGAGYTRDNFMTFDARAPVMDSAGRANDAGKSLGRRITMQDGSGRAYDTTGAFMVGELERLDMTMHQPLVSISFGPLQLGPLSCRNSVRMSAATGRLTTHWCGRLGRIRWLKSMVSNGGSGANPAGCSNQDEGPISVAEPSIG